MRNYLYIAIILALLLALFSCSEEKIKTSTAKSFIYYPNRYEFAVEYWDTITTYNFFFYPEVDETVVKIPVKVGGKITETDRTFLVDTEIIGEGIEGQDFELNREQIIAAGKNIGEIPVKLMRRAEMEGKSFQVKVRLRENENFSLDLPWAIDKNKDTIQRTSFIVQYQAELSPPIVWESRVRGVAGYWSIPKFYEMNKLWGTDINDWLSTTTILANNSTPYMIVFANYLNGMAAKGPEYAIKDPSKDSERGYMTITGLDYFGIRKTVIPADFPTTSEWEGNK